MAAFQAVMRRRVAAAERRKLLHRAGGRRGIRPRGGWRGIAAEKVLAAERARVLQGKDVREVTEGWVGPANFANDLVSRHDW